MLRSLMPLGACSLRFASGLGTGASPANKQRCGANPGSANTGGANTGVRADPGPQFFVLLSVETANLSENQKTAGIRPSQPARLSLLDGIDCGRA